eukprot:scaffold6550_cov131-Isochrysis_galbana.AAC.18
MAPTPECRPPLPSARAPQPTGATAAATRSAAMLQPALGIRRTPSTCLKRAAALALPVDGGDNLAGWRAAPCGACSILIHRCKSSSRGPAWRVSSTAIPTRRRAPTGRNVRGTRDSRGGNLTDTRNRALFGTALESTCPKPTTPYLREDVAKHHTTHKFAARCARAV